MTAPQNEILIGSKHAPASEMIGRVGLPYAANFVYTPQTVDLSRTDYGFWDQLRYGKKADYSIGGLFAKPISRILAAWTLGKGVDIEVETSPTTEAALNAFLECYLVDLIATAQDHYSLGDAYLVSNPDGTIIRVSPDQVMAITDPPGSQNVVGYTITSKLLTETRYDSWYADRRVVRTIDYINGLGDTTTVYPNLIGAIPVIPWHCDRGANELYGRPYYEALLNLFARYHRTIMKSLDGVDIMGNPIPTVEGADDPQETLRLLSGGKTREYTDEDGNTQTQYVVDFSRLPVVVLGSGASMKFTAPQNGFTNDAGKMLEYLFLLMLQHTGIPEWAWGGAIASSKASVDAQMPAFIALIDGLRLLLKRPLLQLFKVWLAYQALYVPNIDPTAKIHIGFAELIADDRGQKLNEVKFAREDSMINRETGLRVLGLVDDPEQAVQDAQEEAQQDNIDPIDAQLTKALESLHNDHDDPIAEIDSDVDDQPIPETEIEPEPAAPVLETVVEPLQLSLFDFEVYAVY
jgi:hypothetical protein